MSFTIRKCYREDGDHILISIFPEKNPRRKRVIFCLDLSNSMKDSLYILKSALSTFETYVNLCFMDIDQLNDEIEFLDKKIEYIEKKIKEFENGEDESFDPEIEQFISEWKLKRDVLFRQNIDCTLIGFNSSAKLIWDNDSEESFSNSVESFSTGPLTNLGAGLEMAFECAKKNDDKEENIIIIFSDGSSNKGAFRNGRDFKELMKETPDNTKIITIGYKDDIDTEILKEIGNFVYVENGSELFSTIRYIAKFIISSSHVSIKFERQEGKKEDEKEGKEDEEELNDNSLIFSNIIPKGKFLYEPLIISYYLDNTFIYKPHGNYSDKFLLSTYKGEITIDGVKEKFYMKYSKDEINENVFKEYEVRKLYKQLYYAIMIKDKYEEERIKTLLKEKDSFYILDEEEDVKHIYALHYSFPISKMILY